MKLTETNNPEDTNASDRINSGNCASGDGTCVSCRDSVRAKEDGRLMKALREFLDTIPAMPQVEHVAGIYRWTAEQYLALIKLHNTFHEAGPDRTPDTVEYWKSRATTAELKVLTFHEEIVKLRSGPDRTTPQFPDCNIGTAHECCVARMKRLEKERYGVQWAGPDRGQQDAPDGWISCAERLPTKRGFYLVWPARGMKHAEVFYRNNYGDWVGPDAVYPKQTHWQPVPAEPAAKAAREGQAPTGDGK